MARRYKFKFGNAFPDELAKVSQRSNIRRSKNVNSVTDFISVEPMELDTPNMSDWRRVSFVIFYALALCFILARLFKLQIIEGSSNRELADSNRIQIKTIHAPRGVIYDRNGRIMAQNEPGFRLSEPGGGRRAFKYISRDEALKLEVAGDAKFQNLEVDSLRAYPLGLAAPHILGFISEISESELADEAFAGYKAGDRIGKGGVEQTYEKFLKGTDGGEIIETDAQNKKLRTLRRNEPIPGHNLYLTIDSSLQEYVYKILKEEVQKLGVCCAVAVAQDPNSGEILALVSVPSFNPKDVSSMLGQKNSPFLNRAIAGAYPPGSTFKIVSALSGLESGKISESTNYEDTGIINLGPYTYSNWYFTQYGKTEGKVDLVKALQRSNDTFFYYLGQSVGEKNIADMSRRLGFGKISGIDLPGESEGVVPDNDWKVKNIGDVWYPGDTLHMAIGQGFVLVTPLQISSLASFVASGGQKFPPRLALKIAKPQGGIVKEFKFDPAKETIRKENLELVKKGLEQVTKPGGTAWPFFNFPISVAGKTGTAEFGDAKNKTHAWFTAYAPSNEPKVAVTVLVEAGGEGSSVAAPVAKEILRWYFSPDKTNLIKDNLDVSQSAKQSGNE